MTDEPACVIILHGLQSGSANCTLGTTFGCYPGTSTFFVAGGCSGVFSCSSSAAAPRMRCGHHRRANRTHNCSCPGPMVPATRGPPCRRYSREREEKLMRLRRPDSLATFFSQQHRYYLAGHGRGPVRTARPARHMHPRQGGHRPGGYDCLRAGADAEPCQPPEHSAWRGGQPMEWHSHASRPNGFGGPFGRSLAN